ncbi:predicted protein [Plenodomus lingam JN3]|uniref:Predicted protein n=1 Tax=Leptosphaeria maculans (strain JN3 / isolate v23.1.3 / race Av1-4-5-6-7-8) TaxID=985895 RepID=E5R552_LEPMJ|nr:predicted protein [Plenodomus lingam JN3]CBX92022.1 predicted protein [Plenodomus lingam JN3]
MLVDSHYLNWYPLARKPDEDDQFPKEFSRRLARRFAEMRDHTFYQLNSSDYQELERETQSEEKPPRKKTKTTITTH